MADHDGHRERMRDRLNSGGNFADHELLEMALFYSIPRMNTNTIAHRLLDRFGSVENVLSASVDELTACDGVGRKSAELLRIVGLIHQRAALKSDKRKTDVIVNSSDAIRYVSGLFSGVKNERLYLVSLDAKYRAIGSDLVSEGTIDEAAVYPRRILWAALSRNASAVILAHNHPGGSPRPSTADIKMTLSLSDLFRSVNIRFADHIIYSDDGCYLFSSKAVINDLDENEAKVAQYARPRN